MQITADDADERGSEKAKAIVQIIPPLFIRENPRHPRFITMLASQAPVNSVDFAQEVFASVYGCCEYFANASAMCPSFSSPLWNTKRKRNFFVSPEASW